MDSVDIRVDGAVEIRDALDRVDISLSKDEVQKYCMQAGFMFEESAKYYASGNGGGPQVRTGNLRASIQTEPTEEGGAEVSPHAEYAYYVEMGTAHSHAYPYMRPAYETTVGEAEAFLTRHIGENVEIAFNE